MAEASIPVDLFNPGQVFACLGLLEAADFLLADAEGGFDWSDETDVRFLLRAPGDANPFAIALKFLAEAEVHCYAPIGYTVPAKDGQRETPANSKLSESFPNRKGDRMALPIRLKGDQGRKIDLGHWADGSSRNEFKLYAGNRSAYGIACAMLRGSKTKTSRKQSVGNVNAGGITALWNQCQYDITAQPLDVLTPMGGSFNFDPRGAWNALDAGYSPNQQKHGIAASPVVEMLAAWGLEHARPDEYEKRKVRYGVWGGLVPPILARPALGGADVAIPIRRFRFVLDLSGKNKIVTFGEEEETE